MKYVLWVAGVLLIINAIAVGYGIYIEEINLRYAANAALIGVCAEILFIGANSD